MSKRNKARSTRSSTLSRRIAPRPQQLDHAETVHEEPAPEAGASAQAIELIICEVIRRAEELIPPRNGLSWLDRQRALIHAALTALGWVSSEHHAQAFTGGNWEDYVHERVGIRTTVKVTLWPKGSVKVQRLPGDAYERLVRGTPNAGGGWSRIVNAVICVRVVQGSSGNYVLFWTNWPLPSDCLDNGVLRVMRDHAIPITRGDYIQLAYRGQVPDPWTAEHEDQLPVQLQDWRFLTFTSKEEQRQQFLRAIHSIGQQHADGWVDVTLGPYTIRTNGNAWSVTHAARGPVELDEAVAYYHGERG
jgi:hypothetical protein